MSEEPGNKRRKMNANKRNFSANKHRNFLEPGIRGFLATCNFREKDCVRESYNLLNEFADATPASDCKAVDESGAAIAADSTKMADDSGNVDGTNSHSDDEEEDISTQLQKEIATINSTSKNRNRFQQIETKVPNCIFIKTTLADPNELGVRIIRDIAKGRKRRTRYLLRLVPVEVVCKANVEDVKNAAGKMFDKVFLNTPATTFAILVNKRYNNEFDRMGVITELANMISFKNPNHKVDLKRAKHTIILDVIKGLCCISILPDYNEHKKYNIFELTKDIAASADGAPPIGSGGESGNGATDGSNEAAAKPDAEAAAPTVESTTTEDEAAAATPQE